MAVLGRNAQSAGRHLLTGGGWHRMDYVAGPFPDECFAGFRRICPYSHFYLRRFRAFWTWSFYQAPSDEQTALCGAPVLRVCLCFDCFKRTGRGGGAFRLAHPGQGPRRSVAVFRPENEMGQPSIWTVLRGRSDLSERRPQAVHGRKLRRFVLPLETKPTAERPASRRFLQFELCIQVDNCLRPRRRFRYGNKEMG